MNTQTRWTFLLLLLVALLNQPAWADGKFFLREKVPAGLPYQRALLIFDEGTETLVVQSKYDLPATAAADSLAWVVPVPSVPELESMHPIMAFKFFFMLSLRTRPNLRHISPYVAPPVLCVCLVGAIFYLIRFANDSSGNKNAVSKRQKWRSLRNAVLLLAVTLVLLLVFMPPLSIKGLATDNVETLKSQQVGVYDVTVIRGDSAEAIVAWLMENGFAFGNEDEAVFADYVARNWCFVAAKVRTDEAIKEERIAAEGMAAPLVLTFPTDKPVYPLALTATAGVETEILLYTLSPNKPSCGDRLELRHAGKTDAHNVTDSLYVGDTEETIRPMESLPDKPMILCKFKGTLTAAQMREDLVLTAAPDNTPYRESIWVW